jgi:poly(A)-specific ribonuclease
MPLFIYPPPSSEANARHGSPHNKSAMQKWAVHTLVRDEYPNLKSRGLPDCIQIETRNGGAMHYDQRMEESSRRIRRHVGFRWIVEALVGGDVNLEPSTFEPLLGDDRDPSIETKALTQRLKSRLKENRPILVGHNCFTDLIYFYQCFLGPLPDKVEEFISLIHQTFPIVVDTKYLATQEKDDGNPSTSLEELTKTLAKIRTPKIGMCFFFFTRG